MKRRISKTRALQMLEEAQQTTEGLCVEDPTILFAKTSEEAEKACAGCPILLECRVYGKADKAASGVWGGEVFADLYPDDEEEE